MFDDVLYLRDESGELEFSGYEESGCDLLVKSIVVEKGSFFDPVGLKVVVIGLRDEEMSAFS